MDTTREILYTFKKIEQNHREGMTERANCPRTSRIRDIITPHASWSRGLMKYDWSMGSNKVRLVAFFRGSCSGDQIQFKDFLRSF